MRMDVPTVVAHALTFNTNTFVHPALQGLSDADLLKRPSDQCNPMGWLLWHQTRVEDVILSHISGLPQAWVAGQWHENLACRPSRTMLGSGIPSSR
jgi:DinB superfamily